MIYPLPPDFALTIARRLVATGVLRTLGRETGRVAKRTIVVSHTEPPVE